MKISLRNLGFHTSIYFLAQVATAMSSFLVLPIVTRFLTPADYGVMAVIDLTHSVMAAVILAGMPSAIFRHHFDSSDPREQAVVWWTGFATIFVLAGVGILPPFLFSESLTQLMIHGAPISAGYCFQLGLITIIFQAIENTCDLYFRARLWSMLAVVISLTRLVVNIGLTIGLLRANWGITGVFMSHLVASVLFGVLRFLIVAYSIGPVRFSRRIVRELFAFGIPTMVSGILTLLLHQSNRYQVNWLLDKESVGIYSLAHQVAMGVNRMLIMPFAQVWGTMIFEVHKSANPGRVFALAFKIYCLCLIAVFLGVSLVAIPLVRVVAAPAYFTAASLIPIVSMGYFFFSLCEHFGVPMRLHKSMSMTIPSSLCGVFVCLAANYYLIQQFQLVGAAWATLVSLATTSAVLLIMARRLERYPYPHVEVGGVLLSAIVVYVISLQPQLNVDGLFAECAKGVALWAVWAGSMAAIYWRQVARFLAERAGATPTAEA